MSPAPSKEPITAEMLEKFMNYRGFDNEDLSRILGVDPATVRRWKSQDSSIHPSGTAELVLRAMMFQELAKKAPDKLHAIMGVIGASTAIHALGSAVAGLLVGTEFYRQRKSRQALEPAYELYTELKKVFEPLEFRLQRKE